MTSFTELFEQALTESGLSQAALARKAAVSPSTITMVKKGQRPLRRSIVVALAEAGAHIHALESFIDDAEENVNVTSEWAREGRREEIREAREVDPWTMSDGRALVLAGLRALEAELTAAREGAAPQDDLDEVVAALRAADSDGTLVRQATGVLQALLPTSAVTEGKRSA